MGKGKVESMIKRIQRKLDYLHIRNVRLIKGSLEEVDLPDQSIDVIVSNLGINNFENPEEALRTSFKVAKPDGQLVMTTNLAGHMHEFYDVFRETLIGLKFEDRLTAFEKHVGHRGTVVYATLG